jgi:hypothetical protein
MEGNNPQPEALDSAEEIKMYPRYIIHECECVCEDPNYSHLGLEAPAYAFEVFQILDNHGKPMPVVCQCDNCNRIWQVEDYNEVPEMVDLKTKLSFSKNDFVNAMHPQIIYKLEKIKASTAIYAWCFYHIQSKIFNVSIAWNPKINRYNKNKVKYYDIRLESSKSIEIVEREMDLDIEVNMGSK